MTTDELGDCASESTIARAALEVVQAVLTLEYYDPKWLALDERTRKAALLRLIRETIRRAPNETEGTPIEMSIGSPSYFAAWPSYYTTGYVVWIYRQGRWEIKESHCADCHEPGPPPDIDGEYENQCVAQACVRRPDM